MHFVWTRTLVLLYTACTVLTYRAASKRVRARNHQQSNYTGCGSTAGVNWRSKGFEMVLDKQNGHAYIACHDDHSIEYKISCVEEECNGDPGWCFVKKGCGGILGGTCTKVTDNIPVCAKTLDMHRRKLVLRVNGAMLTRSTDMLTDMDPFVSIRIGTKSFQTPMLHGRGNHPLWRFEREIMWEGEPRIRFQVKDLDSISIGSWTTDDIIGNTSFNLLEFDDSTRYPEERWGGDLDIVHAGEKAGSLNIHVEWHKSYELIQASKVCLAPSSNLCSAESLTVDGVCTINGVGTCAEAVHMDGGKFFAFGKGESGRNECKKVNTDDRSCKEGWKISTLGFYSLNEEKESDAECRRNTGGTCGFSSCDGYGMGETECIDRQCLCKAGFCFDGKICKAACTPTMPATDAQRTQADAMVKLAQDGSRFEIAAALQNLTKLGESASMYVDVAAQYLEYGHDFDHFLNHFGSLYKGLVGSAFQSAADAISGGVAYLAEAAAMLYVPYIMSAVLGAQCTVMPLSCLAIQAGAMLIGIGASSLTDAFFWPAVRSRQARLDLEFAMVRANATLAVSSMGQCGQHFAAAFSLQLADEFPQVRMRALTALEDMGIKAVPYAATVALLLNDPVYSIRIKAKDTLAVLGVEAGRRAAGDLSALMSDGSSVVEQTLALRSMSMLGEKAAMHLDRVEELLHSSELGVKQAAAQVMAMCGPKTARFSKAMIDRLKDNNEDEFVRGFVAVALTKLSIAEDEIIEIFPEGLPPYVQAKTGMGTEEQIAAAEARADHKIAIANARAQRAEKDLLEMETRAKNAEKDVSDEKVRSQRMQKALQALSDNPAPCTAAMKGSSVAAVPAAIAVVVAMVGSWSA